MFNFIIYKRDLKDANSLHNTLIINNLKKINSSLINFKI
jgi:hypothetical protein